MSAIPFGETVTYGDAKALKQSRVVGQPVAAIRSASDYPASPRDGSQG
jgi:O6-methylguanine-DNA--protein-cysteine methyltransferase